MTEYKMFVWEDVLFGGYTTGMCCVLAEDIEGALQIIIDKAFDKNLENNGMWESFLEEICGFPEWLYEQRGKPPLTKVLQNLTNTPKVVDKPDAKAIYGGS